MATKKTLKKYQDAYSKAKNKYNSDKKIYNANKKTVSNLEARVKKATGNSKETLKRKLSNAKNTLKHSDSKLAKSKKAVNAASKNLTKFKKNQNSEKRKAALKTKAKIFDKMKKEKPGYWAAKRPWIVPVYPGTENSFVFIDNTSESESTTSEMTTNAVSPGQYVNHFTQTQPIQRQIEGKLGGASNSGVAGLKKQFNILRRWAATGTEVEYRGQKHSTSAVLTSVTANFDQPRDNAIAVSVSLQDVKWAQSTTDKKKKKTNDTGKKTTTTGKRKKVKPKAGKYLTIKKGDTYWGYHMKFGTSISKLRSWNGYPDRKLPIGKKVRVK